LLRRLAAELGVTVFLSSHLLSEIEHTATDVGIIRSGRLIFQGPVEALQAERQPRVALRVDRAADAVRLLRAAGWTVSRHEGEPGVVTVDAASDDDAARVNGLLVLQGVRVHELRVRRSSLEDVFLRLTSPPQLPGQRTAAGLAAGERA
jgi:ABC-2 type transport system ATP-binding protein